MRIPKFVSLFDPRIKSRRSEMPTPAELAPQSGERVKGKIGSEDSRKLVRDAHAKPYRSICLLFGVEKGNNRATIVGTGWLAGPDLVVTAAHNIYNIVHGGYVERVFMWFGHQESDLQNGAVDWALSYEFSAHPKYTPGQDPDFDIAAIHLDRRIGDQLGFYKCEPNTGTALQGETVRLVGYPTDLDPEKNAMFEATDKVLRDTQSRILHRVDSGQGQSGAPLWIEGKGKPTVIGIHTKNKDVSAQSGEEANVALRLTPALINWIKDL